MKIHELKTRSDRDPFSGASNQLVCPRLYVFSVGTNEHKTNVWPKVVGRGLERTRSLRSRRQETQSSTFLGQAEAKPS